ncbi:MAG: Ras GTPase activating protein ira2 [Vezdaea aestivalis]|nr:MAG: Ras GTPase activating protein ira2 [Vezdaea aestivalis]
MSARDSKLIYTLVDRLATKLPHRTGAEVDDVRSDNLVILTQDTLIESSKAHLPVVIDALLPILDDLFRSKAYAGEDTYLRRSEIYLVGLLAACCSASSDFAQSDPNRAQGRRARHAGKQSQSGMDSLSMLSDATTLTQNDSSVRGIRSNTDHDYDPPDQYPEDFGGAGGTLPTLENAQAQRLLDSIIRLFSPLPDDFELPSTWLLDGEVRAYRQTIDYSSFQEIPDTNTRALEEFGRTTAKVVEYLSLSNWSVVFTCFQGKLRLLRSVVPTAVATNGVQERHEDDVNLLAALQIMVYLHLNGRQLSLILQELNGCFLSLRKDAQIAIAVLLPGTVARWMKNNPAEFASLHSSYNKAINGADVLFEMANAITDSQVRRKGVVWPMQTALVLLVPEAFWVAANMRDSRSGQVAKKAAFLEALRKGLSSPRNHQSALFCLIWLCQAATRFSFESESALYSYAVDFQTDVRQGILHFVADNPDDSDVDYDLLVASLAALAQLDLDPIIQVAPRFFDVESPRSLRIGLVGACSVLANQGEDDRFDPLFARIAPFLRRYITSLRSHPSLHSALSQSSTNSPSSSESESLIDYGLTNAVLQLCGARFKTLVEVEDESDETMTDWLADPNRVFIDIMAGEDENLRNRARVVAQQVGSSKALFELRAKRMRSRQIMFEDLWRFSQVSSIPGIVACKS